MERSEFTVKALRGEGGGGGGSEETDERSLGAASGGGQGDGDVDADGVIDFKSVEGVVAAGCMLVGRPPWLRCTSLTRVDGWKPGVELWWLGDIVGNGFCRPLVDA